MIVRREPPKFCAAALLIGAAALFPLDSRALDELPAPAVFFSTQGDFELVDFELADVVNAEWPKLSYDAGAARAARAYAAVSAQTDATTLASDDLRLILRDAGLPESTAVCALVATTEEGFDDVLDHLRVVMATAGEVTHIGLGRVRRTGEPPQWLWAILLIERQIDLVSPVPQQLSLGSATPLRFTLRDGWHRPRLLVQYPSGLTRRMTPVEGAGGWFTVIPAGSDTGETTLQVLAEGPLGPRVAAQMPIWIGARATVQERPLAPDESNITNSREAEAHLFESINSTRTQNGLATLEWDTALAGVARDHSVDMVEHGFFGHVSPTRGNLQQRLADAGFTTSVARENVARDTSLTHAHGSLIASPGHRANVLAPDVDRIGIGIVAEQPPGARLHWVVTEIYTRPYAAPSPEAVLAKRQAGQAPVCRRNPVLDELATWFVRAAPASAEIDGPTFDELKKRLEETGIGWKKMSTEVAVVHSTDEVAEITKVDERRYSTCGMAARTIDGEDGREAVLLAVVLIEPK